MKWNYDGCKAFPFECPICGCGHSEPQKTCDSCGSVIIEDEKIKYVVTVEVEATDKRAVIDWLTYCNYPKEIKQIKWVIKEE